MEYEDDHAYAIATTTKIDTIWRDTYREGMTAIVNDIAGIMEGAEINTRRQLAALCTNVVQYFNHTNFGSSSLSTYGMVLDTPTSIFRVHLYCDEYYKTASSKGLKFCLYRIMFPQQSVSSCKVMVEKQIHEEAAMDD